MERGAPSRAVEANAVVALLVPGGVVGKLAMQTESAKRVCSSPQLPKFTRCDLGLQVLVHIEVGHACPGLLLRWLRIVKCTTARMLSFHINTRHNCKTKAQQKQRCKESKHDKSKPISRANTVEQHTSLAIAVNRSTSKALPNNILYHSLACMLCSCSSILSVGQCVH
jgi:hypothetical protein